MRDIVFNEIKSTFESLVAQFFFKNEETHKFLSLMIVIVVFNGKPIQESEIGYIDT